MTHTRRFDYLRGRCPGRSRMTVGLTKWLVFCHPGRVERWRQDLEWWLANWAVLAALLLWFVSLLNSILPLVIVQRRLPALSLSELTARCPGLGWLRWGYPAFYVSTGLGFGAAMIWLPGVMSRLSDARGGFLLGAVFAVFPLIAGILALATGVYRGMTGQGFTRDYYRVAGSALRWLPRAQVGAAIGTAALSLAGFFGL